MFARSLILPKKSFFLFGARGTGKSTFLKSTLKGDTYYIDLLDLRRESELLQDPQRLSDELDALSSVPSWIVIDEVQKIPSLLDVVHSKIEANRGYKFALTGSSARKLKRGNANLLAGRARILNMFPLTHREIAKKFDLLQSLEFGTLPGLWKEKTRKDKELFLADYCQTYLKEEIIAEQLVRKLRPFRAFLPIAAQMNACPINYSKMAADCQSDAVSVSSYYDILEDTLIGFRLPAFEGSLRKRQRKAQKFYFFDTGVLRALSGEASLSLQTNTSSFGMIFESWIINEIRRLKSYAQKNDELFYFESGAGLEIDLVIKAQGQALRFVEIKSAETIREDHLTGLRRLKKDYPKAEYYCLSREKRARKTDGIYVLPWKQGLIELGF